MKSPPIAIVVTTVALLFALVGCATADGDYRHGAPPPGSHSPFSQPDESDPTQAHRDEPEPPQEIPDEEEPEEPDPER